MVDAAKDTIYIDIDDEITSIIDKVDSAKHKIVALVLPKRATVLQSVVNMKLLKRTADEQTKKVVLITSEPSLLPLAGGVGLYVAKTLQSKPAIPSPPQETEAAEALIDDGTEPEPDLDKNAPVGELAGLPAEDRASKLAGAEETIDIDNLEDEASVKKAKKNRASKIKIPNFDKFRVRLFLIGGGLILLIIFWFLATHVWPKAKITIKTNSVALNSNISFTADTAAKSLDPTNNIVPATVKDVKENDSQKVSATGQKNIGNPATGTLSMTTTTDCASPVSPVPAGVTVSANNSSFTTSDIANFNPTGIQSGKCIWTSNSVGVTSQGGGAKYNLSAQDYAVSGYPGVTGQGSQMAGGTDNNVTVVSQSDIDSAKQKITDNNAKAKDALTQQFKGSNLFALVATILPGTQTVTTSAKAGDQASDVTVAVETDYTMLGVNRADLKKLVENDAKKHIDTTKQAITNDGLDTASFTLSSKKSANNQSLAVQTNVVAGAEINATNLKQQIAGKKKGDVILTVQQLPSVVSVNVNFSPFWVDKTPSNPKKVTIDVQKTQQVTQ